MSSIKITHRQEADRDTPREDLPEEAPCLLDPELQAYADAMTSSGLNASVAMGFLSRLIAKVPRASKEGMERIKMMDKLLNTARAMMETKLKNEETTAINRRLDELEEWIDNISSNPPVRSSTPTEELWNGSTDQ
jgi:hypothetical protein